MIGVELSMISQTIILEVARLKPEVRRPKSQIRELVETVGSAVLIAAFIMIFIARA